MILGRIKQSIYYWVEQADLDQLSGFPTIIVVFLILIVVSLWHYYLLNKLNYLKKNNQKLQENKKLLDLFFAQSLDGVFLMMLDEPIQWDETIDKEKMLDYVFAHQRLTKINQTMLEQYCTTEEQMLGSTPNDFFAHDLAEGRQIWRRFFDAGRLRCETFERKFDGTSMWIEGDYLCLYDPDGKIRGHVGIQRDITEIKQKDLQREKVKQEIEQINQKLISEIQWQTTALNQVNCKLQAEIVKYQQVQEQLRYDALHDRLTGLPNRNLLMDRLAHLIERSQRYCHKKFAVLFLDVDRFKLINDSLGYLIGDQLLIALARRLQESQRVGDTIARIGGDEFVILLEELTSVQDAIQVSQRIQQEFALPFKLENQEIFISVSIGITYNRELCSQPTYLLRNADLAMHAAKARGKARYELFNPSMHNTAMKKLALENQLKQALSQKKLVVYYQPIVELATNLLTGFEALVRWQPCQQQLVSPQDFLPLAENIGIIIEIDLWVLREACRQLRYWQDQSFLNTPLTISVNLSAKHFSQPRLIEQIDSILEETGLEGQHLKLEITENVLIENAESTIEIFKQLQQRKIQICLDDFGTGYCSLKYLQCFPINNIKIDRSFVSQIDDRHSKSAIIRAMMMIAKDLKIDVIAEGIETSEQLEFLNLLGCQYVQGYWFSPPQSCEKIERWLQSITKPTNCCKWSVLSEHNRTNLSV